MLKWDNKKTDDLLKTIFTLKTISEARKFFRDLLTEQEIIELGNRWQAAQMLDRNIPYTIIEKKTGLSSTTVARVSRWLNKGKGGYKLALNQKNRSHHHNSSSFEKGLS